MKKQIKEIKSSAYIVSMLVITLVIFPACLKKPFSSHDSGPPAVILLAQAQFINQAGENGDVHSVPGPAKLTIVHQGSNGWETSLLEDPKSNVFHKALWFTPKEGQPGILTIAGNQAALKLWHRVGAKWEPTSIWGPDFGGEQRVSRRSAKARFVFRSFPQTWPNDTLGDDLRYARYFRQLFAGQGFFGRFFDGHLSCEGIVGDGELGRLQALDFIADAAGLRALEAAEKGSIKEKFIVCRTKAAYKLADGTWVMNVTQFLEKS